MGERVIKKIPASNPASNLRKQPVRALLIELPKLIVVDYPVLQRRGYCYDTDVWAMNGQIHKGRGIDKKTTTDDDCKCRDI